MAPGGFPRCLADYENMRQTAELRAPRRNKPQLIGRLDVGVPGELYRRSQILVEKLAELLDAHELRLDPDLGQVVLHRGGLQSLLHNPVQTIDDVARRVGRRRQSDPEGGPRVGISRFGQSRHTRQQCCAL